jgi:hypothetical protein
MSQRGTASVNHIAFTLAALRAPPVVVQTAELTASE